VKARRRFRRGLAEGQAQELLVEIRDASRARVQGPGAEVLADFARLPDGRTSVILPSGRQLAGRASLRSGGRVETWIGARRIPVHLSDPLRELAEEGSGGGAAAAEIRARIPGRVIDVRVGAGDLVSPGTTLVVLEAMKMQNEIQAESDARVLAVECVAGQAVDTGAILVRLEPRSPE
jgi:3-methylcrotonyl-CoA carboxylase alpha subunit